MSSLPALRDLVTKLHTQKLKSSSINCQQLQQPDKVHSNALDADTSSNGQQPSHTDSIGLDDVTIDAAGSGQEPVCHADDDSVHSVVQQILNCWATVMPQLHTDWRVLEWIIHVSGAQILKHLKCIWEQQHAAELSPWVLYKACLPELGAVDNTCAWSFASSGGTTCSKRVTGQSVEHHGLHALHHSGCLASENTDNNPNQQQQQQQTQPEKTLTQSQDKPSLSLHAPNNGKPGCKLSRFASEAAAMPVSSSGTVPASPSTRGGLSAVSGCGKPSALVRVRSCDTSSSHAPSHASGDEQADASLSVSEFGWSSSLCSAELEPALSGFSAVGEWDESSSSSRGRIELDKANSINNQCSSTAQSATTLGVQSAASSVLVRDAVSCRQLLKQGNAISKPRVCDARRWSKPHLKPLIFVDDTLAQHMAVVQTTSSAPQVTQDGEADKAPLRKQSCGML